MCRTWEILAFCANTLIFAIVGVLVTEQVDSGHVSGESLFSLITLYLMISAIRPLMFIILRPLIQKPGLGPHVINLRNIIVSCWGGLRGAVGMALALLVKNDYGLLNKYGNNAAEVIIFNTTGIVLLTLVINATTMSWLLDRLGMTRLSHAKIIAVSKYCRVRWADLQYTVAIAFKH